MNYPAYNELKNDYTLEDAVYADQINEIGRLRCLAWQNEDGINEDFFARGVWIDEFDQYSHLWIIRFGSRIVASARLSIHNTIESIPWNKCIPPEAMYEIKTPVASMNRLAVHPDFRKRGLSKPLDMVRISKAKSLNAKTIIAEPVLSRFTTLEKYGFKHYGMFGSTHELPGVALGFKMLNLQKQVDE